VGVFIDPWQSVEATSSGLTLLVGLPLALQFDGEVFGDESPECLIHVARHDLVVIDVEVLEHGLVEFASCALVRLLVVLLTTGQEFETQLKRTSDDTFVELVLRGLGLDGTAAHRQSTLLDSGGMARALDTATGYGYIKNTPRGYHVSGGSSYAASRPSPSRDTRPERWATCPRR
jgi:hypothetical protein